MIWKQILYTILISSLFSCKSGNKPSSSIEDENAQKFEKELPQVSVIKVNRDVFMRELHSNGRLSAVTKADLRFRSAEMITSISVQNGQYMSIGQEIARIDNFELRNRVITANEAVENALTSLQDFLLGFRYELKDTSTIPPSILQTGYSRSQLLTARVNLAQARYNLENSVLKAPISGVVANITAKEHNIASVSEPFCTIIGNDRFEIEFPVLESEIELLKSSNEVLIEPLAFQGTKLKGRLTGMNPVVDKNGMVQAKAVVENSQGNLYEGMNVRVLVQQAIQNKLVVPKSAVVLRNDRQVLFVYANGRSQWRYVKTGLENSREYTIEEQLEDGEEVIVSGNFNLAHDVEVEVIRN